MLPLQAVGDAQPSGGSRYPSATWRGIVCENAVRDPFDHWLAASPNEAAAWFLAAQAMRDSRARDAVAGLNLPPQQLQAAVNRANQLLQSYRRRERVANPTG